MHSLISWIRNGIWRRKSRLKISLAPKTFYFISRGNKGILFLGHKVKIFYDFVFPPFLKQSCLSPNTMVQLLTTPLNVNNLRICYVMSKLCSQLNFFSVSYAQRSFADNSVGYTHGHGPIIQVYETKEELTGAFPHVVPENLLFYLDQYVYKPERLRERNELFYDRLEQHFERFPPIETAQSYSVNLVEFLLLSE